MSDHQYQFNVKMSCGGCSGAVTKALNRLEGVKGVNADLKTQLVDVTTAREVSYDSVLAAIKKTGKEVVSGKTVA
ncbi:copper metallochaperone [Saccharomycopsis crataegensis]|uniref:Copper metallochaperone n=1 Tax=Saccharomycopsis crataegensis TaxID=43959 RepID=A0AAV5QUZ7_9ASCO|nr:copper metallochaperone [Saccharomycopsis crataegensis]